MREGFVVWLTGLPCSGKSTIARQLEKKLLTLGSRVEVLDGDEVRQRLTHGLGYSRHDRDENIRRIAFVAKLLSRNGIVVISAAISPYRDVRDEVRAEIPNFIEVYVSCPVEECIRRDCKGLYKKALAGGISNFTGVSDPYEPPVAPEVVAETDRESVEESVAKILEVVRKLGYLAGGRHARSR